MQKVWWKKYELQFTEPRGTSRGWFTKKPSWYILSKDTQSGKLAIGECGLLPGLSIDDRPEFENILEKVVLSLNENAPMPNLDEWPSIAFGLEIFKNHQVDFNFANIYPSAFSSGKDIQINGLIWMGSRENMLKQIKTKLDLGFGCIKLKIGSIDFNDELELLRSIRKEYSASDITLRVDANGAFTPENALDRLYRLAECDLHSIEQPIKANQWEDMAKLCQQTPMPIALDEELIGITGKKSKEELLKVISPQAIVLKPSLIGGFISTSEWIDLAKSRKMEWWITSALESDIGLNAIAQYTSSFNTTIPQGLGTGSLYSNNIKSPLEVHGEYLHYNSDKGWEIPF